MHDFMTVETVQFPKGGGQTTPGHSFSDFTFRYSLYRQFRYRLILTINVPVVYMDVLNLLRAPSITRAIERGGAETRDFFGPSNDNERWPE